MRLFGGGSSGTRGSRGECGRGIRYDGREERGENGENGRSLGRVQSGLETGEISIMHPSGERRLRFSIQHFRSSRSTVF